MREIGRIAYSHLLADTSYALIPLRQQFLCPLNPLLEQIFLKCHMKCIFENYRGTIKSTNARLLQAYNESSAKINRIQINMSCYGNDG